MPPPPPPAPAHNDVFHQPQPVDESPPVFISYDNNTHLNHTANDVTLDHAVCDDAIEQSRDDDNVAMVTQRTVVVANDNDDNMAGTVARQPAANDDVMQPVNGNENDVILIPEAMNGGIWSFLDNIYSCCKTTNYRPKQRFSECDIAGIQCIRACAAS